MSGVIAAILSFGKRVNLHLLCGAPYKGWKFIFCPNDWMTATSPGRSAVPETAWKYLRRARTAARQSEPRSRRLYLNMPGSRTFIERAERVASECGIARVRQEEYAIESRRKAGAACDSGFFESETVTVEVSHRKGPAPVVRVDEMPRTEPEAESPVGSTAATESSGGVPHGTIAVPADGAASCVFTHRQAYAGQSLQPLARVVAWASSETGECGATLPSSPPRANLCTWSDGQLTMSTSPRSTRRRPPVLSRGAISAGLTQRRSTYMAATST